MLKTFFFSLTDHSGDGWQFAGGHGEVGDGDGEDDPGAGAHPQQVVARQQRRHPQARRLVLPNDVVAACWKFNKNDQNIIELI